MPWVVLYIVVTALLAWVAGAEGERKRMWGLIAIIIGMAATHWLYNFNPGWILAEDNRAGPLYAGLLWVTLPILLIGQQLKFWTPAILGECSGVPYILYAFGWLPEWPALLIADLFGIAMIGSLGGPPVVSIIGRIAHRHSWIAGIVDMGARARDHLFTKAG